MPAEETLLFVLRVLIVVALYGFLGLTLWALLRERHPAQAHIPPARLVRQDEAGKPANGQALKTTVWIGRDPNCAVRVSDEFVSARHARINWDTETNAWWIEDNSSRNGTWVNEERVIRCALSNGDLIRVGDAHFRFEA